MWARPARTGAQIGSGAIAVALGLSVSACGSGDAASRSSSATSRTLTRVSAPPAPRGLLRFLFRAGDEPGFASADAQSAATLSGWIAYTGLGAADAQRLRSEGFLAGAQETLSGHASAGASSVEEFRSPTGARREAIHGADVSPQAGTRVAFFSVPELPNAHGVTIAQQGGVGTNLYWTEGRCRIYLGNAAATSRVAAVEAGARVLYRRTLGHCP